MTGGALLISSSEKGRLALRALLEEVRLPSIETAASGSEARRLLTNRPFSLVVVNAPLSGENGSELALFAASTLGLASILLVRQEELDGAAASMGDSGVLALGKPINGQTFLQAVRLAQAAHAKIAALQEENRRLLGLLEEQRLVNRAKWLLIENKGLTEPQAHHFIEKQAMDQRITKRQAAQDILDLYI
ncbi:MAG: ANTAR domain-containing protein [Christensenellaceae bacterium]|nr:ANTAR domain-containing protein [Christensenellaceae bacterium]